MFKKSANRSSTLCTLGSLLVACVLTATSSAASAGPTIDVKAFGATFDGTPVEKYTLTNGGGLSVSIITYGAAVTNLVIPDRAGKLGDVVLGFDNLVQYENESPYFGAIIGRVANRIAHGIFTVDQTRYCVPINNGPNHLHGGFRGYDRRVWKAEPGMTADGPSLRLTLIDPDGDEGYPGTVKVTVIYSLTGDNALKIQYYAATDKATPINLTNHTYFNLKDAGASSIEQHVLEVLADFYTPVDATLIPNGEIAPVKGTPIDFTSAKPIGRDLQAMGGKPIGYDHNLVLRSQDGSMAHAATVADPDSGRLMEVWTTQPGLQFYSGNFLDGTVKGKGGVAYEQHNAFCLETQHYPDSINHPKFPDSLLRPGEVYREITEYRFSTLKPQ